MLIPTLTLAHVMDRANIYAKLRSQFAQKIASGVPESANLLSFLQGQLMGPDAFWVEPASIPVASGNALRMKPEALSVASSVSSLLAALDKIRHVSTVLEMFSTNTRGPIAFMKRAVHALLLVMQEVCNAVRPHVAVCAATFSGELPVPVLIPASRPTPAFAVGTLAGGLVNLAPKTSDVFRRKRREWLRIIEGHVSGLLIRSTDGLRDLAGFHSQALFYPKQVKGTA